MTEYRAMNVLRLSYVPEDVWHGELTVSIASDGFSRRGSAWFNCSQIDEFTARLEPCPIVDGEEPSLAGGIFRDGRLAEELVGLRVAGHDLTGTLRVCVHLATRIDDGRGQKQDLNAILLTTYADVARFKTALAAHLSGHIAEAELLGRRAA